MKIILICIICVFKVAVRANEFNSSLLESRMLGGRDANHLINFVATIGEYAIAENGLMYRYFHRCSAFMITSRYLATAYYCDEKLHNHRINNYSDIRAFVGEHELNFEEWTLITSHQIARPIKNLWSLNIFGNAYSYSSYNSITYIQLKEPMGCTVLPLPRPLPMHKDKVFLAVGWVRKRMPNLHIPCTTTHRLAAASIRMDSFVVCHHNFVKNIDYDATYLSCGYGIETANKSKTLPEDYGAPVMNMEFHVVAMTIPSSASRESPNYFLRIHHILRLIKFLP